jgi:MFS family permease
VIFALLISKRSITNHHERFSLSSIKELKKFPELIILLIFCTSSFGIIISIYPAFLDDRGMSDRDILLVYFAFGISRVISLALAGRFSRKTSQTLIASTASISIGLAISATSGSIIMFAVAMVFMGFGFSIFFPLTLEIILSRTSRGISGKIIGAYETIFGVGWAIGPTLGGPIAQSFGNQTPYIVFFIIGIAVTSLAVKCRKKLEPKRV